MKKQTLPLLFTLLLSLLFYQPGLDLKINFKKVPLLPAQKKPLKKVAQCSSLPRVAQLPVQISENAH